jgi:MYXO-CTERM domain-containing protein
MRSRAGWFIGVFGIVMGIGAASAPAWADIPPPQACTAPGQPCSNAGTSANQAGTCTTTTCSRTMPLPDGGTMVTNYSCMLCQVSGAGGSGDAGSGSGGHSGSGSGGSGSDASTTPGGKSSGCSIGGGAPISSLAGPLALAGLLMVTRGRRRRRDR